MAEYTNNDVAMSWDDIIENDNEFTVLPEGDYDFTIVDLERKRFEGSAKMSACPKAEVSIKIYDRNNQSVSSTTVKENLLLNRKMEWKLCQFFTSIGLRKHGEPLKMNWKASCLHRFADVYKALNWKPNCIDRIDIWNLRGKSSPMDKFAPKLIRRAAKKGYIAVIIDPIYKVLTGDENSAEQMSKFCNEFDKICSELGCAVIYCHHHSKGNQGAKRSMDRASGSGVFARDPDAMLDLIELEIDENLIHLQEQRTECAVYKKYLERFVNDLDDVASQDDLQSASRMRKIAEDNLPRQSMIRAKEEYQKEVKAVYNRSGWRMEGTLREFPKLKPINCWFDYPIHKIDDSGILQDIDADLNSKNSNWKRNFSKKKSNEERAEERKQSFEIQFESLSSFANADKVSVKDMAQAMGVTEDTVRKRVRNELKNDYRIVNGYVETNRELS